MATLILEQVVKAYDTFQTVHGIDLDIADGEFVVLVGPSGCGKSTTLRMIAGLESITSGEIRINGKRVNELEPGNRDIAMVFQNYALYPHLSVADNIAFGLKLRKTPRAEIARRLRETAEILDIEPLLDRKPRQLSGGQRQRVAMGRALIRNPEVFLFDEPLSNLDAKLRVQMRTEIKRLHAAIPTTTVYVTHDQVEAMTLADRVVVMNKGRIEQIAAPQTLYRHPATKFVAGFIGSPGMNFLPAELSAENGLQVQLVDQVALPVAPERQASWGGFVGKSVELGIRPEHFRLAGDSDPAGCTVPATLSLVEPLGMETLVHVKIGQTDIVARLAPDDRLVKGATVGLVIDAAQIHLIDLATDRVIY